MYLYLNMTTTNKNIGIFIPSYHFNNYDTIKLHFDKGEKYLIYEWCFKENLQEAYVSIEEIQMPLVCTTLRLYIAYVSAC